MPQIDELYRQNSELRAKLEAAEADTRRLDWIADFIKDPEDYDLTIHGMETVYLHRDGMTSLDSLGLGHGPNLRDAIDAAMDAQKGGE